jgi:hypothetical protein
MVTLPMISFGRESISNEWNLCSTLELATLSILLNAGTPSGHITSTNGRNSTTSFAFKQTKRNGHINPPGITATQIARTVVLDSLRRDDIQSLVKTTRGQPMANPTLFFGGTLNAVQPMTALQPSQKWSKQLRQSPHCPSHFIK